MSEDMMRGIEYIAWVVLWMAILSALCGCAGNSCSYYDDYLVHPVAVDAGAPLYYPSQDVWVRRLGQPDELVTIW